MAQVVATAVVLASFYALLGAGYVLVYRATRVLNLAQGDLMTLGGYLLFSVAVTVPGRRRWRFRWRRRSPRSPGS